MYSIQCKEWMREGELKIYIYIYIGKVNGGSDGLSVIRDRIVPVIENLAKDKEFVIRIHIAMQLPAVASCVLIFGGTLGSGGGGGGGGSTIGTTSVATPSPITGGKKSIIMMGRSEAKSSIKSKGSVVSKASVSSAGGGGGGGGSTIANAFYKEVIVDSLLPVLQQLLSDRESADVRAAAVDALVKITPLIKSSDLMEHILSIVINLAHEVEEKDLRITSAFLLSRLASLLGSELFNQFVAPEWVALSEDQVFQVRRAAALNFVGVLKENLSSPLSSSPSGSNNSGGGGGGGGGNESSSSVFSRLLQSFSRLCQDANFAVRKACAESIVEICTCCSGKNAHELMKQLGPFFEGFCSDKNEFVKRAGLLQLGRFLSIQRPTEDATRIKNLLPIYLGMSEDMSGDKGNEIRLSCAYHYPGIVLLVVGSKKWSGAVQNTFSLLARDSNIKVRCIIASCLHDIGKVIGGKSTMTDLLPIFDSFVDVLLNRSNSNNGVGTPTSGAEKKKSVAASAGNNNNNNNNNNIDELEISIVKNMSLFIAEIPEQNVRDARAGIFGTLMSQKTKPSQWRIRYLVAEQCSRLSSLGLFSADTVHKVIVPMILELIDDPVFEVCTAATKGIGGLLGRFVQEKKKQWLVDLVDTILTKYAKSTSYLFRQKYILICEDLFGVYFSDGSFASSSSKSGKSDDTAMVTGVRDIIITLLMNPLLGLGKDKTTNVQIRLARTLSTSPMKVQAMSNVKETLNILKSSSIRDVSIAGGMTEVEFENIHGIKGSKSGTKEAQLEFAKKAARDAHEVLSKPDNYAGGGGKSSKNIDNIPIEEHMLMAARALESLERRGKIGSSSSRSSSIGDFTAESDLNSI
jgi:hypothetical protein